MNHNTNPTHLSAQEHPDNGYKYIRELNYFNATACLLVIFIHVVALGISELTLGSWQQNIIYFPWRLAAFVVPAFLFSGAVKTAMQINFLKNDRLHYFQYMKERCRTILLPYVSFSLIYFFILGLMGYIPFDSSALIRGILTGDLSGQFYYIIIVMQFYLLLPLCKHLIEKTPIWAGLPISLMISMFTLKLPVYLNMFGISSAYIDRFCLLYAFFWCMGLYAGKLYDCLYDSLFENHRTVFLLSIPIICAAIINQIQIITKIFVLEMDFFKMLTDAMSILVLLTACILLDKSDTAIGVKLKEILNKINKASYFVYLAHCIFITVTTLQLQMRGINDISLLLIIRAFLGYTMPFLLYFLWQRCKALSKSILHSK